MKALEFSLNKGPYGPKGNYLSGWMANLGVVPLFLFLLFLRAPALCFLLALLALVFLVRETMVKLPRGLFFCFSFVHGPLGPVKNLILLFFLLGPLVQGSSFQDHIISTGEHLEIKTQGLKRFSVTDQDVIAYKWLEHLGQFLVEGKKVGYSELIIWNREQHKVAHRFYVLSKRSFLKLKQIQKSLMSMGLQARAQGQLIIAQGTIEKEQDYFVLHKILKQNPKRLVLNVKMTKKLRNTLIGKAYQLLFGEVQSGVSCGVEGIQISCFYQKQEPVSKDIAKILKKNYFINLIGRTLAKTRQNYRIRLLVLQFERADGKEISLGLAPLAANMEDLFTKGVQSLVAQNKFLLAQNNIQVSTLASPEAISTAYQESVIEVGSEIPYHHPDQTEGKLNWKFAGIRLKITLAPNGKRLQIKYLTEVKNPSEQGQVAGSLNSATATIALGKSTKIFQISLQSTQSDNRGIPYIGKIPLIGKMFSSSKKGKSFKRIIGYLKVEKSP